MKRIASIIGFLVMVFWFIFWASTIWAQPYPNRPIQIIIPNVAGSFQDIPARAFSEVLGKVLGTQIIPINKPGASTTVGLDIVVRSKKDGYTLAYGSSSGLVYAPILNPQIPYDPHKDLEPLGSHVMVPHSVAVQANLPWKSLNELLDYAKMNPEKLRFSTIGVGSNPHFTMEIIQSITGVKFTHVPFKGGESVIAALLGGHVEMSCDIINKLVPHMEAGKIRVLLITHKVDYLPDVPTLIELGYKQELPYLWFAMYGPAGMPDDVKKVLIPAIEKAVKDPDLKAKMEKIGFTVYYKSPEEFRKIVLEEYNTALAIAKKIGLRK
jgi:tripartite-type tricarboxylate transporter receptor subunit TctC